LAGRSAREFLVIEMEDLDALIVGKGGRHLTKMLFDAAAQLGPRERNVILIISDDQAGDLLPDSVRQTYDAELLYVGRALVDFLESIRINVFAVRIDDDFLRTPNQKQVSIIVNPAKITGV